MDISYFQKLNNTHLTSNKKEVDAYKTKNNILKDFDRYAEAVKIENINREVMIMDSYSMKDGGKKIISKPDETFNYGDIVEWNGEHWLITEKDASEEFYAKGKIVKCVSTLKWQDQSLRIIEAPFTLESTPSQLGLDESRIISLPNERRNIIIQSNDNTQKIIKGQRFIFDNRAWSVTGLNGLTTGLIYLALEETEINTANDNVELRIADYTTPTTTQPEPIPTMGYSIVIVGSDTIKQNQTQVYVSEVYANGVKVVDGSQQVVFTLYADDKVSSSTLGTISTQDGIKCSVKNNDVTSGYVQLKVELQSDSSVIAWKQIQMKPLW